MPWDENDANDGPPAHLRATREVVDIDTLDDGRCKASSWRSRPPVRPTYENLFGPGGYNRCIGTKEHVNPHHKDEWGNVFMLTEKGFLVLRKEEVAAPSVD